MKPLTSKKIIIWLLLTFNLLFAFSIGLTIPLLETNTFYNLGFVMIPLLIILNYILLDRFHFYVRHSKDKEENTDAEN